MQANKGMKPTTLHVKGTEHGAQAAAPVAKTDGGAKPRPAFSRPASTASRQLFRLSNLPTPPVVRMGKPLEKPIKETSLPPSSASATAPPPASSSSTGTTTRHPMEKRIQGPPVAVVAAEVLHAPEAATPPSGSSPMKPPPCIPPSALPLPLAASFTVAPPRKAVPSPPPAVAVVLPQSMHLQAQQLSNGPGPHGKTGGRKEKLPPVRPPDAVPEPLQGARPCASSRGAAGGTGVRKRERSSSSNEKEGRSSRSSSTNGAAMKQVESCGRDVAAAANPQPPRVPARPLNVAQTKAGDQSAMSVEPRHAAPAEAPSMRLSVASPSNELPRVSEAPTNLIAAGHDPLRAVESDHVPHETAGHALPSEFAKAPQLACRALGVYACLRTLSRVLALSPFPPLALLRGLVAHYQNALVDEVHVVVLRLLARRFKVHRNDGARVKIRLWGFLDRDDWPAYFVYYVEARQELREQGPTCTRWEDAEELLGGMDEGVEARARVLAEWVHREEYHTLPLGVKVEVLEYLCNRLMDLPEVAIFIGDKAYRYDYEAGERARNKDGHAEACRICDRGGDLLLCDFCPAVYHHACVGEKQSKMPATWICPECRFPDPSYFGGRIPEYYCRASYNRDPGREEDWVLRVIHGYVMKQVLRVRPAPPQVLTTRQAHNLLLQLGELRSIRWPFSQLRRPAGMWVRQPQTSCARDPSIDEVSLNRSLVRFEDDPSTPEYSLDEILDFPVGRRAMEALTMPHDQIKGSGGGYVELRGAFSSNSRCAAGRVRDYGAAEPDTAMELGENQQHPEGSRKGMLKAEAEEERLMSELPDDPDEYLARHLPELHELKLLLRSNTETDPANFNPFLYVNRYRVMPAPDVKPLALPLLPCAWRPRFACALKTPLDLSDSSINPRVCASVKPLPVVLNWRFDNRSSYLHLEKAKDMLMQFEAELRGLLGGPWETGSAVAGVWTQKVFLANSVRQLGRFAAMLACATHPRAFIAAWHSTRPSMLSAAPTALRRTGTAGKQDNVRLLGEWGARSNGSVADGRKADTTVKHDAFTAVIMGVPQKPRGPRKPPAQRGPLQGRHGPIVEQQQQQADLRQEEQGLSQQEVYHQEEKQALPRPHAQSPPQLPDCVAQERTSRGADDEAMSIKCPAPEVRRAHDEFCYVPQTPDLVADDGSCIASDEGVAAETKALRLVEHKEEQVSVDSAGQGAAAACGLNGEPSMGSVAEVAVNNDGGEADRKTSVTVDETLHGLTESDGASRPLAEGDVPHEATSELASLIGCEESSVTSGPCSVKPNGRKSVKEAHGKQCKGSGRPRKAKEGVARGGKGSSGKGGRTSRAAALRARKMFKQLESSDSDNFDECSSADGGVDMSAESDADIEEGYEAEELQQKDHLTGSEVRQVKEGRLFEVVMKDGQVEWVTTKVSAEGGYGYYEKLKVALLIGGRKAHKYQDRANLPKQVLRRLARNPLQWRVRPPGVTYPTEPDNLPRAALSHLWVYQARHVRTSSQLNQLLRVLDHCIDHDRIKELHSYSGSLVGHRVAQGNGGALEVKFVPHGVADEEGTWAHEDEIDIRLIKTYRGTVVDPANAKVVHGRLRRKAKLRQDVQKYVQEFQVEAQALWRRAKAECLALVSEDDEATSTAIVDRLWNDRARDMLEAKKVDYIKLYQAHQAKLLEVQRRLWQLEKRPAWYVELNTLDYETIDATALVASDMRQLKAAVRRDVARIKGEPEPCGVHDGTPRRAVTMNTAAAKPVEADSHAERDVESKPPSKVVVSKQPTLAGGPNRWPHKSTPHTFLSRASPSASAVWQPQEMEKTSTMTTSRHKDGDAPSMDTSQDEELLSASHDNGPRASSSLPPQSPMASSSNRKARAAGDKLHYPTRGSSTVGREAPAAVAADPVPMKLSSVDDFAQAKSTGQRRRQRAAKEVYVTEGRSRRSSKPRRWYDDDVPLPVDEADYEEDGDQNKKVQWRRKQQEHADDVEEGHDDDEGEAQEEEPRIDADELHCSCRAPSYGFMIACETCGIWFHGPCVGVTEEMAASIDEWYCLVCTSASTVPEAPTTSDNGSCASSTSVDGTRCAWMLRVEQPSVLDPLLPWHYIVQPGDEVVYLRAAHDVFLQRNPGLAACTIPPYVHCPEMPLFVDARVVGCLQRIVGDQRVLLVSLSLRLRREMNPELEGHVLFKPDPDSVIWLVHKSRFLEAVARKWAVNDRVVVHRRGEVREATIVDLKPAGVDAVCAVEVECGGDRDWLGPWQVEPLPEGWRAEERGPLPTARPGLPRMEARQLQRAIAAVDRAMQDEMAAMFVEEVPLSVADYLDVVPASVCLSLIRQRLQAGHYRQPAAFFADLQCMISNSMAYNGQSSAITKACRELVQVIMEAAKDGATK